MVRARIPLSKRANRRCGNMPEALVSILFTTSIKLNYFWTCVTQIYFFGLVNSRRVAVITLNKQSMGVNVAAILINSLAFFVRYDHHDAITETHSLSLFSVFHWLAIFTCLLRCFSNYVRKTGKFAKPRHDSLALFYIEFQNHVFFSNSEV